ncbi:hypothetical protein [Agromyces sp. SYSU T00194]|uniref:hypothetical protein n=1 Tax=Agromyces chitinivorans TaxID=3158560 RepID=UPI00339AA6E1
MSLDERQGSAEVLLNGPELNRELVAGSCDLVQLHLDTRGREFAIGSEVDEVLFLHGQLAELGFELLTEELLRPGLVGDCLLEARPHRGDERLAEADRLVVDFDGSLDALHVGVGRIADVILHTPAEEVRVLAAIPAGGAHDDHALDDPILETATAAPDGALEVMIVLDATLT